jgi:hypothetical protein
MLPFKFVALEPNDPGVLPDLVKRGWARDVGILSVQVVYKDRWPNRAVSAHGSLYAA